MELATCQKLGIQLDHDPDELAQIDSQIDAAIQTPALTQALSTLSDAQRQALQLRVVDEMGYDEAAALMEGQVGPDGRVEFGPGLRDL